MEPQLNILKLSLGHVIKAFCKKGDVFYAKTGSIVSIKGETQIESVLHGGIIKSALRVFGGENVFLNKITCISENAEVILGTLFPSEIVEIQVDGSLFIADNSYLAHTGDITLSADIGYLTSVFAGSGLMFLKAEGKGKLYLAGGEAVFVEELKENEHIYIDNSAFLATFDKTRIDKLIIGKGIVSKFFSSEGIMFKIYGPTKVWYQTEGLSNILNMINRK